TIAVVALAVPEVFGVSTNNRRTFSTTEKSFLVLQRERSFPLKSIGQARATRKMLDQLEKSSSPEQRLFVGPLDLRRTNYNDTFIYHLMLQLRPATYFSQSTRFTSPRRYRSGGLARSRPELRMSGTTKCVQRVRLGCIKPNGAISI